MDIVSSVVVYILLWWWVFFMTLPFGVKPSVEQVQVRHLLRQTSRALCVKC